MTTERDSDARKKKKKSDTRQDKLYFDRVNIVAWEMITMFFHFRKESGIEFSSRVRRSFPFVCSHCTFRRATRTNAATFARSFAAVGTVEKQNLCISSLLLFVGIMNTLWFFGFFSFFLFVFHSFDLVWLLWRAQMKESQIVCDGFCRFSLVADHVISLKIFWYQTLIQQWIMFGCTTFLPHTPLI